MLREGGESKTGRRGSFMASYEEEGGQLLDVVVCREVRHVDPRLDLERVDQLEWGRR